MLPWCKNKTALVACIMQPACMPSGWSMMSVETESLPSFMEWKDLDSLVGSIRTRSLVARPTTIE